MSQVAYQDSGDWSTELESRDRSRELEFSLSFYPGSNAVLFLPEKETRKFCCFCLLVVEKLEETGTEIIEMSSKTPS